MNDPREFEAEENDDLWDDVDESELLVACELAADEKKELVGENGDEDLSPKQTVCNDPKTSEKSSGSSGNTADHSRRAGQKLPPLKRYKGGYLWVSDLTAQVWCEQKLVYSYELPCIVEETPAIAQGTNLHLARELAVQDTVPVKVTSDVDIFAVKVINLLSAMQNFLSGTKIMREIPIFGAPFEKDVFIIGMIDEMRFDLEKFTLDIQELKTRAKSRTLPSKSQRQQHKLQVMLYKKLYDDLVKGITTKETISRHLKLDLQKKFGADVLGHLVGHGVRKENLDDLLDHLFEKIQCMTLANQLFIEYCFQGDNSTIGIDEVHYDESWFRGKFDHFVDFWCGARDVEGVEIEEAWKCQMCEFADVCEWRARKAEECLSKRRKTQA